MQVATHLSRLRIRIILTDYNGKLGSPVNEIPILIQICSNKSNLGCGPINIHRLSCTFPVTSDLWTTFASKGTGNDKKSQGRYR